MSYETVLVEKGAVATLALNRPDARNALNGPLIRDILAALRELDGDAAVRVVVIKGEGTTFCSGADINQFLGKKIYEAREHLRGVADICETMAMMGKPIITQVHGFALAGGCGLAVAGDLTYAAEDAVFGTPEINIGIWPHVISAPVFRAVGRKRGLEMMFTGDRIDAKEAERIGLITRAVPADRLEDTVQSLATRLASKSSIALRIGKESFYTMFDMEYVKALHYLREMIAMHSVTDDAQEGARAFVEKRQPVWKGQ